MARAHCMLVNHGYRHTVRICNIYCLATETMVHERSPVLRYNQIVCLVKDASPFLQEEWNWEIFFYPSTYVSPVSIILPMFSPHLHRNSSLIRRTSGRANI